MYRFSILIFTLLSSISVVCNCKEIGKLKSVLLCFRHGDRSPKGSFPNDPYFNISYWPMGLGQLTDVGIKRQYELGKWLRHRYDTFLAETYLPSDIYVFSTDIDRTLMSAAANLAGLYPQRVEQTWNKDLLWRPVPIHTIPRNLDSIIMDGRPCDKYDKLYEEIKKSSYANKINEKYSAVIEFVSNQTGRKIKDIAQFVEIQSTLQIYEIHNKSFLPPWAALPELNHTIQYLASLAVEMCSHTDNLKRLLAGPFFHNLITHFENAINELEGAPKFFMISAHDMSLVPILNSMSVFDFKMPSFAAAIIFELREKDDGTYYVNVAYKRDELEELTVKECDVDCDFDTFKKLLEPFIADIERRDKECKL